MQHFLFPNYSSKSGSATWRCLGICLASGVIFGLAKISFFIFLLGPKLGSSFLLNCRRIKRNHRARLTGRKRSGQAQQGTGWPGGEARARGKGGFQREPSICGSTLPALSPSPTISLCAPDEQVAGTAGDGEMLT